MTVILRYVGVGHVIFKELLCNKLDTPKERVSYPSFSDGIYWWLGDFGHVLFKELLCNKFVTLRVRMSYPTFSDSIFWMFHSYYLQIFLSSPGL